MSEGAPKTDVAREVSGAAAWAYAGVFADRAIRFALFVIVARLVNPAAFGTVVLSLLLLEALQAVLDTGLATALIQSRDPARAQLDTAFTLTLAAGGVASALLALGAGPVTRALGEPQAAPLLQALAAAPLVNALGAVPLALLQRELSFKALAARTAGSSLLASLLGVGLAVAGFGAWALVARALALAVAGTAAAWLAHPYRPRLRLDATSVREVAPAGLRLWASGLASQVNGRGFDLLAGVVLGVAALGALRIAGQTVLLMVELTVGPMTAAGFALLSKRRDDPAAFAETFDMLATCAALLIFPAFAGLFVVADPLLPLMFGDRWGPAAGLVPFMCAVAPALYANLCVTCALFAVGRTDLMLKGALVEAVFTAGVGVALVLTREKDRSANGQSFLTATEGRSFEANFAGFAATPAGGRLIGDRPDVDALLKDRATLAACPPGSFGRAYADFLTENGFDEEAYMAGARAAAARLAQDPPRAWYRLRTEASHDVRHVLSGYGAEVLAEACVLALRAAQLNHAGAMVLASVAALGAKLREGGAVLPPLIEAWRRGRASRCLDHAPFELDPSASLADLQAWLGLTPPRRYWAWRKERAAAAAARTAVGGTRVVGAGG